MSTLIQLASKEFDGTDYVYVYADGTPSENGEELRAATEECKANWNLTGRRQTVLVGPGAYNLNFDPISIDGAIDITGISSTRDDVNVIPGTLALVGAGAYYANFFDVNDGSFANDLQDLYVSFLNQGYGPGPGLGQNSYKDTNGDTIIVLAKAFSTIKINTRTKAYQICSHSSNAGVVYVDKITSNIYTFESSGGWRLKKFNSSFTGFDPSFTNPIFNNPAITSITSDSSGSLYICGSFNVINGFSRNRFVKLQSNGSLDPVFNIGTGFNGSVTDFALDNVNNQIIAVGFFTNYDGNTTPRVARVNKTTGAYSTLPGQTAPFSNTVISVDIVESSGYIIFSGYFTAYNASFFPSGAIRTNLLGGSPVQFINSYINGFDSNNSYYDIYEEVMYLYPSSGSNVINGTPFDLSNSVLKIEPNLTVSEVITVTPGLPAVGATASLLAFTNSDGSKYILYPKILNNYQYFPVFIDNGFNPLSLSTNTISNMIVQGPVLTNTNANSTTILKNLNAYYVKTYDDFYNPSNPSNDSRLTIKDSVVNYFTFSRGELVIDSSDILTYQTNTSFASSNIVPTLSIFITKSRAAFLYDSQPGVRITEIMAYDSELRNCFSGLTNSTYDPDNGQYTGSIVSTVTVENCRIESCFYQTLINTSRIKQSIITGESFYFNNNGNLYHVGFTNYDLEVFGCTINNANQAFIFALANNGGYTSDSPINFSPNIKVNGVNITNVYTSFQFNISSSFRPYIFFSDVTASLATSCMSYTNTLLDSSVFTVDDYGSVMKCINCSVTNEQGEIFNTINYTLSPEFANNNYNTGQIAIQGFIFHNCSVSAASYVTNNTLNVGTTDTIGVNLYIGQTKFINCSIDCQNFDADSFLSNIKCSDTLIFEGLQFNNCNLIVEKTTGRSSFLSSNLTPNLSLGGIQFTNCSTPYGFLAEIASINVYIQDIISFIECSVYRQNKPSFVSDRSGASYWNPNTITSTPLLYFENCSISNSTDKGGFIYSEFSNSMLVEAIRFDFIQCTSNVEQCFYKGFGSNTLAIIHASFCKSGPDSFGNQYSTTVELNFSGNITHCSMGTNSLGTNSGAITAPGLVLNLSNTSNSVALLSLYSGSLNV